MSNTVIFRLRGIQVPENQRVVVVGSSPSLGSWVPKKTCFLEQSTDYTYELRVTLDGSSAEYKYVILRGSQVQWEGGENRVVDTTTCDGECNDTWMSTGASEFIARTDTGDVIEEVGAETLEGASEAREVASEEHEDVVIAQKAAAEAHKGSSLRDRDASEAEVDRNTPSGEMVSSKEDQEHAVQENDPKSEQHRMPDSGDTKEPFDETCPQRSRFLLFDRIFKLCRRPATNAN